MNAAKISLWSARILGTLIVSFVLFFLFAHLFGVGEDGAPISMDDRIQFALFPIGLCVGLLLAYKWPALGGLVATSAMLVLFALRLDLLQSPFMLALAVPGVLYLVYAWLKRRSTT